MIDEDRLRLAVINRLPWDFSRDVNIRRLGYEGERGIYWVEFTKGRYLELRAESVVFSDVHELKSVAALLARDMSYAFKRRSTGETGL